MLTHTNGLKIFGPYGQMRTMLFEIPEGQEEDGAIPAERIDIRKGQFF